MAVDRRKSPAPKNMGRDGLKFWQKVTGEYEFRADELRLLEDACRTMSLISALEKALAEAGVYVSGSMGQQTLNPVISELRQQRNTLKTLLVSLKLPDDSAGGGAKPGAGEPRSVQARAAAKSKWAVHHGKAS